MFGGGAQSPVRCTPEQGGMCNVEISLNGLMPVAEVQRMAQFLYTQSVKAQEAQAVEEKARHG